MAIRNAAMGQSIRRRRTCSTKIFKIQRYGGRNVIDIIITIIRDCLGKTDLEKPSLAWTNFVTIKQSKNENPRDFVNRCKQTVTALKNVNMRQGSKTLEIHLLKSLNLSESSKENIIAKVDMDKHDELYEKLAKAMREIKVMMNSSEEAKHEKKKEDSFESKNTYFTKNYGSSQQRG